MERLYDILISIIVPIYNVEKQLPRCIDSLINQTYKNLQIILVNDGSNDGSFSICEEYKKIDKRIEVIHKQNGGLSDARNFGINASKGDYILFIDSDDYIELDSCERFINNLKNRDVDVVVGEAKKICGKNISYFKHTNLIDGREYSGEEYIKKSIECFQWYAPVWLNMYKREFIINNSLYFKKGILHEDMQILPHIFLKAKNIIYMSYCFYNYDIREGSITQKKGNEKNVDDLMSIYSEWKDIFDNVENLKLRILLNGMLVKQYLFTCREFNIIDRRLPQNINRKFLFKYSLDNRERIKMLVYTLAPRFYVVLKKGKIKGE